MREGTRWNEFFLAATVVCLAIPASSGAQRAAAAARTQPFPEAMLFFELNDTDGDLGIHGSIDGDAWIRLSIKGPRGGEMLSVEPEGRLARQGMTQLFFESAEPPFDELPPESFFQRFPEGSYTIEARTLERTRLKSVVQLQSRDARAAREGARFRPAGGGKL
jgi:hypothetical protein